MKDAVEYAEMLGAISVSSCDVTFKPAKKRRKTADKNEIVLAVNEKEEAQKIVKDYEEFEEIGNNIPQDPVIYEEKPKKKFKFDILYAQGLAIFALVVTILLTNIFWENSGINTLFKNAFSAKEEVDARTYFSFSAKSPSDKLSSSIEEGVMTFSGEGALYPVADGKVSSVIEEEGKYTLTIEHSDKFKTVISGVDFIYTEKGADVFAYIPVAFVSGGEASVCMYDDGNLLTDYIVEDGVIIWES